MSRRTHQKRGDAVNGILLLDKPHGITSNAALQKVKTFLHAKKGGHTGSLDPIATGLLPLCFGNTTKLASFFLNADKVYWAKIKFGETTDTGDSEGRVLSKRELKISKTSILEALETFKGKIEQIPPMFSAVKVNGQPLYRLARQGKEIDRAPRTVVVNRLDLLKFEGEEMEIELDCSHGFYVRGLAHDLGEFLGCGAHVIALRRLRVANIDVNESLPMEVLENLETASECREKLLDGDIALSHIPMVALSVDAAFYLCRGQSVRAEDLPTRGWVRLYSRDAGFLGIGSVTEDGKVAPQRLVTPS